MGKRSYSEADKASALALLQANNGNITKTASELKMPSTTLRQWRDGEHINVDVAKKRDEKKADLAELFEEAARIYLARAMDVEAVTDSKGKDAMIAAATAVDKMRLLKGESTSIEEVRDDGAREVLLERLARRGAGPLPN